VAELLRTLEFTITRRLDGMLHGNYQGITPGHGSEPGESRLYQPGDDVRRIDWNVTARARDVYVRDQIADRDLEAWLVVDTSASMRFGTTSSTKSQLALAASAAIGFLTARNQNRLGAVLVAGPQLRTMPPRQGRDNVRAVLQNIAHSPSAEGLGRSNLVGAIERVGAIGRRRGFVAVVSDFAGNEWATALAMIGMRHDLLAVGVSDPREHDLPAIGLTTFVDPASGTQREVMVTEEVRQRFAVKAAAIRSERVHNVRAAGGEWLELSTDGDWLGQIVRHVQRRQRRAVGQVMFR
jgi:uncharacterized protein (DUF58 family)